MGRGVRLVIVIMFLAVVGWFLVGICLGSDSNNICFRKVDNYLENFKLIDENQDGYVDEKEYEVACAFPFAEEEFGLVDKNEPRNVIDFDEFLDYKSLYDSTFLFNRNNSFDGRISSKLLASVLSIFNFNASKVDELYRQLDAPFLSLKEAFLLITMLPNEEFPCIQRLDKSTYCRPDPLNFKRDFKKADANWNLMLSLSEWNQAFVHGLHFKKIDVDFSGTVDLDEWTLYYRKINHYNQLVFKKHDKNRDFLWSQEELESYFSKQQLFPVPVILAQQTVEQIYHLDRSTIPPIICSFVSADVDSDGKLGYREFLKFLKINGQKTHDASSFILQFNGYITLEQTVKHLGPAFVRNYYQY